MNMEITDVSFSYATRVDSGSCGFCRVILNNCIVINRIRVSNTDGVLRVLLPKSERRGSNGTSKPIVQVLTKELQDSITQSVLKEYNRLVSIHGEYSKSVVRGS